MSTTNDATKRADILCELFEVVIHNILYIRELYPHQIFQKSKKYGTIVHQSINPQINEYVAECLKAVHFHLKANRLKTICVCIMLKSDIIERHVFDIININSANIDDLYIGLEQSFRDFCLKLNTMSNCLESLPPDATFIVQLFISEYSSFEFNENSLNSDFPWIQVNMKNLPNAEVVPLNDINANGLKLQSYIERVGIVQKEITANEFSIV